MVERIPNKQYNLAAPDSFPVRIGAYQRRRMYERFLIDANVVASDRILDVGATADQSYESSNYLEKLYPHKSEITAVGTEDAAFLQKLYPGMRVVQANGRHLPFRDCEFDVVHSSAVLEHVGSRDHQMAFVLECCRVARKAVFFTTPNRWFPVEFHTVLPFVHWMPKPIFRAIMKMTGRSFFAEEANLNLLTGTELRAIADRAKCFSFSLSSVMLCGWPSNLLLTGRRQGRGGRAAPSPVEVV
jgi:hypothetical protein